MRILHLASTLGLVPLFLPSPSPLMTSHPYILQTYSVFPGLITLLTIAKRFLFKDFSHYTARLRSDLWHLCKKPELLAGL